MKNKELYIFLLPLLFVIIIFLSLSVSAAGDGFITEPLTEEQVERILKNTNITALNAEPTKQAIICFDVSDNGLIAVGYEINSGGIICVYTIEGEFQRGYKFRDPGSFLLGFSGENLNIYFVRGECVITINPEGEVEKVLKIIPKNKENRQYWSYLETPRIHEVNGVKIFLRKDMGFLFNLFSPSYTQIVVKDGDGNENIIFDVNAKQIVQAWIWVVVIILFISVFVAFMITWSKGLKKVKDTMSIEDRKKYSFFLGN
ncbi:MAG: hypothetical protein IJK58_03740 [Clostridia bacterium]|nr:hypothetical protein [Clostridia bacterium]MBQ6262607.1 hypothetical protein [Clostridia bacterium]